MKSALFVAALFVLIGYAFAQTTGTDQCTNLSGACQLACQGSQVQACRCTNGYPDVICMSNNNNSGAGNLAASLTTVVGALVLSAALLRL